VRHGPPRAGAPARVPTPRAKFAPERDPSPRYRRSYRAAVGLLSVPGRFGVLAFVSFKAYLTATETNGRVLPYPSGVVIPNELLQQTA
jgi:hypothetical protein